jgi:hypothetical protein
VSVQVLLKTSPSSTQVDHGLTTSTGLTQLIRSLALMMLIKNLGRHTEYVLRRRNRRQAAMARLHGRATGGMRVGRRSSDLACDLACGGSTPWLGASHNAGAMYSDDTRPRGVAAVNVGHGSTHPFSFSSNYTILTVNYFFDALNVFKLKGCTTKFHNVLRSTTFIFGVSPFEAVSKI